MGCIAGCGCRPHDTTLGSCSHDPGRRSFHGRQVCKSRVQVGEVAYRRSNNCGVQIWLACRLPPPQMAYKYKVYQVPFGNCHLRQIISRDDIVKIRCGHLKHLLACAGSADDCSSSLMQ
jgi:hypothetical protein